MAYDANSIQTLSFREAVRTRIPMYMGSADNQGVLQCIREIITNSIDEATMGYGNKIYVELSEGNRVSIRDEGRGCPFGKREDGIDALEAIYTLPHSGGKFNDKTYQNVAGLNGIGAKGCALSSDFFKVVSIRNGNACILILKEGIKESLVVAPTKEKDGTYVEFVPSQSVYNLEQISINFDDIKVMCENWSYLCKGISFILKNNITKEKVTYLSNNGLLDFMNSYGGKSINKTPLYIILKENDIEAEIAMKWTNNKGEEWHVFTNGLENPSGGTSLTGVKTALTNFFKKKVKGDFSPDTLRKGLFYAISCKVPNPSFSDQTKGKVNNPELRGLCQRAAGQMMEEFAQKHKDEFEKVVEVLNKEVKADAAAERARQAILQHEEDMLKASKSSILHPDKLRDARKLGQDSLLLCVEGLSAGGSMSLGRDPSHIGILMLRGKVLNLLSNPIEDGLSNEEVVLLLQALGITYGKKYNSSTLRYGRVAVASDSDADK